MIDLIIEHATVITMNSQREILRDGAIAIDATHMVALPGLINTHSHLAVSLQRGVKLHGEDGLHEVVWPIEKTLTAENCYIGAVLGAAEAAKALGLENTIGTIGKGYKADILVLEAM